MRMKSLALGLALSMGITGAAECGQIEKEVSRGDYGKRTVYVDRRDPNFYAEYRDEESDGLLDEVYGCSGSNAWVEYLVKKLPKKDSVMGRYTCPGDDMGFVHCENRSLVLRNSKEGRTLQKDFEEIKRLYRRGK